MEITTDLGNLLTITGYDAGTGVVTYTYSLQNNTNTHGDASSDGNSVFEEFQVVLTDSDGDPDTGTLSVQILDDVPSAEDDTDTVDEDGTATGNVITDAAAGDAGDSDTGADTTGADGAAITGVATGTTQGTDNGNGSWTVQGEHGSLTIQADGSYVYTYTPVEGSLDDVSVKAFKLGESFLDDDGRYSDIEASGSVSRTGNGLASTPAADRLPCRHRSTIPVTTVKRWLLILAASLCSPPRYRFPTWSRTKTAVKRPAGMPLMRMATCRQWHYQPERQWPLRQQHRGGLE